MTRGSQGASRRRLNVDGNNERLLTPGEVATLFRVDPKTVTRWAAAGRLASIRTPGGHRRFKESEVRALLRGDIPAQPSEPHLAAVSNALAQKGGRLISRPFHLPDLSYRAL